MTRLRELFEEAANLPAPPSWSTADEVYAAGRRRRRRRSAAAVASCAVLAVVVALVTAGVAQMITREPFGGEAATADARLPGPGTLPHVGERIQWAGAADAQHLYLGLSTSSSCTAAPCAKTVLQLVGSGDGGRTWSDRGAPINVASVAVLGNNRLVAAVLAGTPGSSTRTLQVSTDGGRSWQPTGRGSPVLAVPAGSVAVCWPDGDGSRQAESLGCAVQALDPVSRRLARLMAQPPLTFDEDLLIEESAGKLWVPGVDPATGRPGVAASANGGRTWSTRVFADAPACAAESCTAPLVATGAGGAAYAVVTGERAQAVYRHSSGLGADGWQRLTGAGRVPYERPGGAFSFVTADGTHVLGQIAAQRGNGVDDYRFWANRSDAYEPVELDGLPATVYAIRRTTDGWFYTHSYTDGVLYGSDDGWHWSPLTRTS
jgi:hypothetical protein